MASERNQYWKTSEDGPLLLTLLLTNLNNNANNANNPAPDTLDPRSIALELKATPETSQQLLQREEIGRDSPLLSMQIRPGANNDAVAQTPNKASSSDPEPDTVDQCCITTDLKTLSNVSQRPVRYHEWWGEEDGHGPLLTLMLTNMNNNSNNSGNLNNPMPDSLDPRGFAMELETHESVTKKSKQSGQRQSWDNEDGYGPLTLLLTNLNNNANNAKDSNNPLPDTLDPKSIAIEADSTSFERISTCSAVEMAHSQRNLSLNLRDGDLDVRNGILDSQQLDFWDENGYLVIPNALPKTSIRALVDEVHRTAERLFRGGDDVVTHTYFPGKQSYVSPVGRAIATLTEKAFKPGTAPIQRIERLGCGIHQVLKPFRKTIFSQFHEELATSLGYRNPRIVQSLIIIKAAEVGAKVVPHQDGWSSFTDPPSCTTFWYALEDSNAENGCLSVVPGSHRTEPIRKRYRNDGTGKSETVFLEKPIFAAGGDDDDADRQSLTRDESGKFVFTKLEVPAGSLVLMHGNLVHASEANQSAKNRIAFNFSIVEGELVWLKDNYLQPSNGKTEFEKLQKVCERS